MTIAPDDRQTMIALARSGVEARIKGKARPQAGPLSGVLAEKRGCFVTLTNRGKLRGCIGTFQPSQPLGQTLIEMGGAAASDPRFTSNPVVSYELPELTIEVSVLTPLQPTARSQDLQIGRDGIYIVSGLRSGCFLPEVATDQGWSAEEFLSYCCAHKAGLPPDAWKDPQTKVYLFQSEKFSE